jgi:hypothetical protein
LKWKEKKGTFLYPRGAIIELKKNVAHMLCFVNGSLTVDSSIRFANILLTLHHIPNTRAKEK